MKVTTTSGSVVEPLEPLPNDGRALVWCRCHLAGGCVNLPLQRDDLVVDGQEFKREVNENVFDAAVRKAGEEIRDHFRS